MSYPDNPTDAQAEEQLNRAWDQINEGGSRWPGMTYEQGVQATLDWIRDNPDEPPIGDE